MDGGQVHQISFIRGDELSRCDLVETGFHVLDGFACFHKGSVREVDFKDMAVAFQIREMADLLGPDSSADKVQDDLGG